jgi:hypothetical protein
MIFKFWTMKKLLTFFVMVSLFLGAVSFAPAEAADDNFSNPLMDDQKWRQPEYVRETVNGKLLLKVANAVNLSFTPRVSNNVINPSSVHSIGCFITVASTSSTDTGDNVESTGRIEGFFYNTQAAGGATGDVWAAVKIGNRGYGLEAWWEIKESLNDGPTEFNSVSSNTIIPIGTLSYDTAYQAKISYDGDRGFTFEVNGSSDSYSGPERQRNAVTGFKAISAIAYGNAGNGYTSVLFDDVTINGRASVYDDFSSQLIDTTKWTNTEFVRECPNGYLRLDIRGAGSNQSNDAVLVERDASYVESKVRIDSSSQLSNGAYGVARIQGYYYNDSRGPGSGQDYNKYIGDVFAQVRLQYESDGSTSARVNVDRCNDTNETNYTSLFSHTFSSSIALDTDYTLSIDYRDNKLIFTCEGEMVEYQIATPSYPPYGLHRLLRSRVYLDSGETGYMKGIFDDVIISQAAIPAPPTLSSPAANANVAGTSVNLSWSASSGATQYWLWVRRTSDNVVIFNQNVGNNTSYNLTGFPNNGKDYFWMVRAGNSSGWSKWTAARRFINGGGTTTIPAIPTLSSPAANANVAGTSVNLSWSASTGATQYWLWVRRTSDNVVIFNQNVGNNTSYNLTGLPNNGSDYFWMVRAGNSSGWSKWTVARRFFNGGGTTTIPAIPTLISPASNANVAGTSVNLSWSASSGATQYWLWVRRTSDNVVIFNQHVGNNTSYNLTGLPNNGKDYFWMVRAGNSSGWSKWTAARRFINGGGTTTIPAIPALISPASNAKVAGTSVNLSWSTSSGATQYWLWARRTSDNVVIFSQNVGNRTSYALTGLPNNGSDYFWMVRAGNSSGWSKWTAARRFFNGGVGATFMDTFDDSFFTNNNWSKMTAVQQVWSFPTLAGSDLGYHVSTTSKEMPGAMIANNNTSYHSAGLYVETLVRIDSFPGAYTSESMAGLGFGITLDTGYVAGFSLDFYDGDNKVLFGLATLGGNRLSRLDATPVPVTFDTFYKLVLQVDSNKNMRASLYRLNGTLLGSVFARNVLAIDSGFVGIWGSPEVTFNNFKLTGNAVD